jgi:hypothetical protein
MLLSERTDRGLFARGQGLGKAHARTMASGPATVHPAAIPGHGTRSCLPR